MRQPTGRLRLWLQLALLRGAVAVVERVPRRLARPICWLAGGLGYRAMPRAREAVRENLQQILGQEPPARLVRQVFVHGALNYWDTLALARLSPAQVLALVEVEGWEHLDAAKAQGKGVIMVGAHLSSPAFCAQAFAARGERVTAVAEPIEPPELFQFLNHRLRGREGLRYVPAGPAAVRELLTALRRNEMIGLISDRDVQGTGAPVDFFGAETTFTDAPAALSLRTGAPILLAVSTLRADGRYRGIIEPVATPTSTGSPKDEVRRLTQSVARRLEYHIGVHPEQWTVFQRRWPRRSSSSSSLHHPA